MSNDSRPTPYDSFGRLMTRATDGSELAAQQLHDRFQPDVLHEVRNNLPKVLRKKYDSQDLTQEVWIQFWSRRLGKYNFRHPGALKRVLRLMAKTAVIDKVRQRLGRAKYNVNRECSLESVEATQGNPVHDAKAQTASQIVGQSDEWEQFIRSQPATYQLIYELHRDGYNSSDIANVFGEEPDSIQRKLKRLFERYRTMVNQC